MSAVSYTASHFSEEDEKRELDELKDAEKEAILDDMYGRRNYSNNINNGGAENEGNGNGDDGDGDVSAELLEEFYDALEQLPLEQCGECMHWEAFTHHNDIYETESNPVRFLRCENYNAEKAALRLCEYWNMRYEIFGEERAFEPMTLQGAMQDVIPFMTLLPNFCRILPDDDYGRTVICVDRTGMQFKDYDDLVIMKIIWFVFHEALKRQSMQQNGVVIISVHQCSNWDFPSLKLMKLFTKSICNCIPMKICCRHCCASSLMVSLLVPVAKYLAPPRSRMRSQLHNSINKPRMLDDLQSFGLQRNLPKSIGGNYDEKPTWLDECKRILKEQSRRNKRQRERSSV